MSRSSIALVLIVVVGAAVGVGVGFALLGRDDSAAEAPGAGVVEDQPPIGPRVQGEDGAAPSTTPGPARGATRAVEELLRAKDSGDGPAFCRLIAVERRAGTVDECARVADLDVARLPAARDLRLKSVGVTGSNAVIATYNGPTFSLKRTAGVWRVRRVTGVG